MSAARDARPTIQFVDDYCQLFAGLFPEVRSFEAFKLLRNFAGRIFAQQDFAASRSD